MGEISEKIRIQSFVMQFNEILKAFLNPVLLLDRMDCFTEEEHRSIRENTGNTEKQVGLFLNYFQQCDEPGTLQMFLDALNNCDDQRWLYPLLNENCSETHLKVILKHTKSIKQVKSLLDILKPQLNDINVEQCLTVLSAGFDINEKDLLLQKLQNEGNYNAIWWLLSFLVRKEKEFIKEFCHFLKRFHNSNESIEGTIGNAADMIMELLDCDDDDPKKKKENLEDDTSVENFSLSEGVTELHISGGEDVSEINVKASIVNNVAEQVDSTSQNSDELDLNIKEPSVEEPKLRNYQKELVELANQGKNVIVSAPPGAGKTIVAWNIIKNFLNSTSRQASKKVLVFTPGGALATQQHERLKKFLPQDLKIDIMCGSFENATFVELKKSDVVVLTPQILLNELKSTQEPKSVESIGDFGLLIFDECHHCTKKHPYNEVMKLYFELKYQPNQSAVQLPQVIGLSATLGIGKSIDIDKATETVKKLCADLDAIDGIVSVKNNINELNEHITQPYETMIKMEERCNDGFSSQIDSSMRFVMNILDEIVGDSNSPPFPRDEVSKQKFKQWCSKYRNDQVSQPSVVGDKVQAKIAHSCLDYLELYTDVLDYYFKFRAEDAVECLEFWLNRQKQTVAVNFNETEKKIFERATSALKILKEMGKKAEYSNPNLKNVEGLLLQKFSFDKQSKGMIMVQMRRYTIAVKNWTSETPGLKFLNAEVFTGTGQASGEEDNSLTHEQQKRIMEDFREGKHKLLICTPDAAGEGMDVAGCNFVIIYDFMTNEITDTQIKGRARRKESEVYQFSSPRVAHRDHLNKEKTILMKKVRNQIEDEIEKDIAQYQKEIRSLQDTAYKFYMAMKENVEDESTDDEYIIQCKRCSVEASSSYNIRVLDQMHHICIEVDFDQKYRTEVLKKKINMGLDWVAKNSVLCKSCGVVWGIECEWKGQITKALIQIKSFKLINKKNLKSLALTPKKWKDVPFSVKEAEVEEIVGTMN